MILIHNSKLMNPLHGILPLGKLTVAQLVKFPELQGKQSLIPVFGRTCHWFL